MLLLQTQGQVIVEEQHPLKQGLKRNCLPRISYRAVVVEEQHPLKQGLKQNRVRGCTNQRDVEEQHPLKQGLKLLLFHHVFLGCGVEEQHPLKQGLKLRHKRPHRPDHVPGRRATSTKTRIETPATWVKTVAMFWSKSNIH